MRHAEEAMSGRDVDLPAQTAAPATRLRNKQNIMDRLMDKEINRIFIFSYDLIYIQEATIE